MSRTGARGPPVQIARAARLQSRGPSSVCPSRSGTMTRPMPSGARRAAVQKRGSVVDDVLQHVESHDDVECAGSECESREVGPHLAPGARSLVTQRTPVTMRARRSSRHEARSQASGSGGVHRAFRVLDRAVLRDSVPESHSPGRGDSTSAVCLPGGSSGLAIRRRGTPRRFPRHTMYREPRSARARASKDGDASPSIPSGRFSPQDGRVGREEARACRRG